MTYSWNRAFESYPAGSMRALTMGEGLRRLKRAFDERLSVQHDVVDTGIPTNGLVAYWPFDEGSGDIARDAAGYNHGTLEGDPDWVSGPAGGALDFAADGRRLDIGSFFDPVAGPITVSVLVYQTDSTPAPQVIITNLQTGPGLSRFIIYTDNPQFRVITFDEHNNQATHSVLSEGLPQNQWVHLVWKREGSVSRMYVDLVEHVGSAQDGDIGAQDNWALGGRTSAGDSFRGLIAEPRVYDRALTEAEIQTLYNEVVPFRVRHRPGESSVVKLLGENDVSMSDFVEGAFKFKKPSLDRDSGMMMQAVVFGHHGDYSDLNMDDHPQYLRVNGDRDLTGDVHMKDVVNLSTTGSDYDGISTNNNRVMSQSGHLSLVSGRARHADEVVNSTVISNNPAPFSWDSGKFNRVQESLLVDQNIELEDDAGSASMVSGLSTSGLSGDGHLAILAADKSTSDSPSLPYHFEVSRNGTLELTLHWRRQD